MPDPTMQLTAEQLEAADADHALERRARQRPRGAPGAPVISSSTIRPSTTVSTDFSFLIASSGTFAGSK